MAKPLGARGSWFAKWKGQDLPCVHKHWTTGIWPHHCDPNVTDETKWPPFIDAIKKGGRVILTEDRIDEFGRPTGDRDRYIGLYRVENVEVRNGELHFDFVERLEGFSKR